MVGRSWILWNPLFISTFVDIQRPVVILLEIFSLFLHLHLPLCCDRYQTSNGKKPGEKLKGRGIRGYQSNRKIYHLLRWLNIFNATILQILTLIWNGKRNEVKEYSPPHLTLGECLLEIKWQHICSKQRVHHTWIHSGFTYIDFCFFVFQFYFSLLNI